jgi:glucose-1-phosphate cytidylyltransferase
MQEGEELVIEPFDRLIAERRLFAYNYTGFWAAMDRFKDKIKLDRMESRGDCPWMLWKS